MKINNLYMTLVVILYSTNITADGNHGDFQCYSSDPEMGDSAYWAGEAIDSFAQNQFEEAIHIVDACFDVFATEAVIMQIKLNTHLLAGSPEMRKKIYIKTMLLMMCQWLYGPKQGH
jgi:hypothetical protein